MPKNNPIAKTNKQKLIPCASTTATPLEKIAGYTNEMDTYKLDAGRGNSTRIKTETRTFSLADFANAKANPVNPINPVEQTTLKEDIFYSGMKIDPKSTTEFDSSIQVCDKNNMTTADNELYTVPVTEFTKNSLGFVISLQNTDKERNGLPTEPGDYRIDGYQYSNGKWVLTNRIDKITFTK